jgi:CRP-like cAMP-binding protein
MRDITPSALRRILTLKQFPILREAELGELAMFAENVTEVVLPPNTLVAREGSRLDALHLVLAGEIATAGGTPRIWGPGQVFGGLEVLADREAPHTAFTTVATTTLQLLAPDVLEILEDSFGVMLAALRGLAGAYAASTSLRGRACTLPDPVRSLGLIERLMLLRQQPAFSGAPLESLVALAHASEEIHLPRGAIVSRAGEPTTSSYVIVEGESSVTGPAGASARLGPGQSIGHLEALASQPHEATIRVVVPMRALKVEASHVFDIIEDHTDFGRAILATLADRLLGLPQ